MALFALFIVPLQILGQVMTINIIKNSDKRNKEGKTEANRLVGDSIINFKTVQSFGHEEHVIQQYEILMKEVADETWSTDVKLALQFGVSNFMTFIVNAALFLIAAAVLENTDAEVDKIFTAIFCMLFGA